MQRQRLIVFWKTKCKIDFHFDLSSKTVVSENFNFNILHI